MTNIRKLPRAVFKSELTTYFSCSPAYLWKNIIKEELFLKWGFKIDDIKSYKQFPPDITERIYVHFEITDLTEDFEAKIQRMIDEKNKPPIAMAMVG